MNALGPPLSLTNIVIRRPWTWYKRIERFYLQEYNFLLLSISIMKCVSYAFRMLFYSKYSLLKPLLSRPRWRAIYVSIYSCFKGLRWSFHNWLRLKLLFAMLKLKTFPMLLGVDKTHLRIFFRSSTHCWRFYKRYCAVFRRTCLRTWTVLCDMHDVVPRCFKFPATNSNETLLFN